MKPKLDFKKIFLSTLIISLTLSALIGILIFLFGSFGIIESRLIWNTLILLVYSMIGLTCSITYEKRRFSSLGFLGIIISVIGFLYTVLVIWDVLNNKISWKLAAIFILISIGIAHSCLLLLIKSNKSLVNFALSLTIFFVSIVTFMLIILILVESVNLGGFYFRLLGVFAILDVLGTIVTPILNKI